MRRDGTPKVIGKYLVRVASIFLDVVTCLCFRTFTIFPTLAYDKIMEPINRAKLKNLLLNMVDFEKDKVYFDNDQWFTGGRIPKLAVNKLKP